MAERLTIIFTHYGYCKYLEYTLACARMTNPEARLILLGDADNAEVAARHGWEHVIADGKPDALRERFGKSFRQVHGEIHKAELSNKGGKDWLRYVFERWFMVRSFVEAEGIERFWHFDSDTMILKDLAPYDRALSEYDFSTQCKGTCINGLLTRRVLDEFCVFICGLFEDETFLEQEQASLDKTMPYGSFNEMRAFDLYQKETAFKGLHLLNYSKEEIFDDCVCHEDGFDTCTLQTSETIKRLWSEGGELFGRKEGSVIKFVTLNLSWVPEKVFRFVLEGVRGKKMDVYGYTFSPRRAVSQWMKRIVNRIRGKKAKERSWWVG